MVLVLRLSTVLMMVAAAMVLVFDTAVVQLDLRNFVINTTKLTFKDLITFKLACFPEFDFYADQIVSYLLATAVGAGFLVCAELKTNLNKMLKSLEESNTQGLGDSKEKYDRFINHGFLASALVLFAFICMAVVSVLSSLNRNSNEKKSIFG
ncbi:CASP-like protein 4D1 [Linum grandiflorum]